jgi:hypothetical protein
MATWPSGLRFNTEVLTYSVTPVTSRTGMSTGRSRQRRAMNFVKCAYEITVIAVEDDLETFKYWHEFTINHGADHFDDFPINIGNIELTLDNVFITNGEYEVSILAHGIHEIKFTLEEAVGKTYTGFDDVYDLVISSDGENWTGVAGGGWGEEFGGVPDGDFCYSFIPSSVIIHDDGVFTMNADGNDLVSTGVYSSAFYPNSGSAARMLTFDIWGNADIAAAFTYLTNLVLYEGTHTFNIKLTMNGGFTADATSLEYKANYVSTTPNAESAIWYSIGALALAGTDDYVIEIANALNAYGAPSTQIAIGGAGNQSPPSEYYVGTFDLRIKSISLCAIPV